MDNNPQFLNVEVDEDEEEKHPDNEKDQQMDTDQIQKVDIDSIQYPAENK